MSLNFSMALSGWVQSRDRLKWTYPVSVDWVLKGLQSPALSGSVFTPSWGSPCLSWACYMHLLPRSSAALYCRVCPSLHTFSLSFVPRVLPLLPWLPPALSLSLTTFPFSECLLSHFLPQAQGSVNIFECINLALLHKGNLPVCHSSAQF